MKINELIFENEYIFSEIDGNSEVFRISADASDVDENSLLIIPNSKKLCTKDFKAQPKAVITDTAENIPDGIPKILVENPRLALANACFRFSCINFDKIKIIAVTGTNGKSTTATFIKKALEYEGYKVGFIGTGRIEIGSVRLSGDNYSMTTPDPTLLYPTLKIMECEGCEAVVMEVSSHSLALCKVAPIKFDYAVFTNLSAEHLDFHKTMEDYFGAKNLLFQSAKVGVFNLDDPYARRSYNLYKGRKIGVGGIQSTAVKCSDVQNLGRGGVNYIYNDGLHKFRINLSLAGIYNVYNSMLAAAVCIDMGCRAYRVKEALEEIRSIEGRFEIIKGEITVIIDYAHTEAAYYNVMKELSFIKGSSVLWTVFGCGGERDREKRWKIASIVEQFSDNITVTTDNSRGEDPKDIISDIIRGFSHKSYYIDENRESAIRTAILSAKPGDVVAIIGKGCEKYNLDKDGYHDFDEKAIVQRALAKRGL